MLSLSLSWQMKGDLEQEARALMERGFRGVVAAVADEARRLAPARTGRLRASIRGHIDGPLAGRVTVGAPYAKYLIAGTGVFGPKARPITIGPRNAKALVWPGTAHPVRQSVIRGIRPNDFLGNALRRVDIAAAFRKGAEGEDV